MSPDRYLDLLAKSLLGELYLENEFRLLYLRECVREAEAFDPALYLDIHGHPRWRAFQDLHAVGRFLDDRVENLGFPYTMIGRKRLDHLRWCVETAVGSAVPGDLMECGVWRGGAAIFMRGYLEAHGIADRDVWLADSFRGLPPPAWPQDEGLDMSAAVYPMLAVSIETVRENFRRHDLLDERVHFLEGWFRDTLPMAPIEKLAILRIDADLYESTATALRHLYPKLSPGGFLIVDDYQCIEPCQRAVDDFRGEEGIDEPMESIDWTAIYWRKSQS